MIYRDLTKEEETIIKRSFNNWRVFEMYRHLKILISESNKEKKANLHPLNLLDSSITMHDRRYHKSERNEFHLKEENYQDKNSNKSSYNIKKQNKYKKKISNSEKNDKTKEVYIYSNENQNEIIKKFMPVSIGLKIGIIQNKKFFPSLNFAEMVVDHNKNMHYPYIIVNDKAANLVLYGRDVMGKSLLSFFNGIIENQLLIILNVEKEVIGIGRSRFSAELMSQPNIITVDNVQDIGTYYLKDENSLTEQFEKAYESI